MGTDPMTDFSISLEMNPKSNDVDEILQLPEKSRRRKAATSLCVSTSSSRLPSSRIPRHFKTAAHCVATAKSVSYCLFGSKKHLMNELFEKKSLPFYKFGDAIYLPKSGLRIGWIIYAVVLKLQASRFQKNWPKEYVK